MKFSICIPNYNYATYLERTLDSVLAQSHSDFEILVSDNASTDASVDVVRRKSDSRIQVRINSFNVGFAGNLDKAAHMASGDFVVMLSSDDMMRPNALSCYAKLLAAIGPDGGRAVVSSSVDVIDATDATTNQWRLPANGVWRESDRVADFDGLLDAPIYRVPGDVLLKRCLACNTNPFFFCATAYSRALYDAVDGYGTGRTFSPDKWFHWRLLSEAKDAYFVRQPLFAYRWHAANQASQQTRTGVLKEQVDEYLNALELDAKLLERLGITRDAVLNAVVQYGIAPKSLAALGRGERRRAKQILRFGQATYPDQVSRNKRAWALKGLLALGPMGSWIAKTLYAARKRRESHIDAHVE